MPIKYFLSSLIFIFNLGLVLSSVPPTHAFSDIATLYPVNDSSVITGDILSITATNGVTRAELPYDSHLFGVAQEQPAMVFRRSDDMQGQAVARTGTAQVNVTTLNGNIEAGDYITSSAIPGKGQKASESGYVIGIALTSLKEEGTALIDYQDSSGKTKKIAVGKIEMALKIEYAELTTPRSFSRAFTSFNTAFLTNIENPERFMRIFQYILAGLAVTISFGVGFLTFSRSIPKSIEAIGRNPLAEKAILFSVVLNIILTLLTIAAGMVAAIFLLRL